MTKEDYNDVRARGDGSLDHIALGRLGENIAAAYLKKDGYKIVERNVSIFGGELDIIALDGQVLAVVEVKTRIGDDVFHPRDAITKKKTEQLKKVADAYVGKNRRFQKHVVRFDLVEVVINAKTLAAERTTLFKRYFD